MSKPSGAIIPIPRVDPERWSALIRQGNVGNEPLVVVGAFTDTDAVKNWTLDQVAARFGEKSVSVSVDLPERGSPYDAALRPHQRRMTVAEFADYLPGHPGTYLAQVPLTKFPGMDDELGIARVVVPPTHVQSLWVGHATRSGLHFDLANGLLAQVRGVKTATLVRAGQFSDLYPYPDVHTKSRVDPDDVDDRAFPRFARVDLFTATLRPGDALFIPRFWWHHLVSDDISISVNSWFGEQRPNAWTETILRAGPAVCWRAVRDFVALGVFKRDFQQRLFSHKPNGLALYETWSKARQSRTSAGAPRSR